MKRSIFLIVVLFFLGLMPQEKVQAQTEDTYEAMEGVSSVNTVFDFRISDPVIALSHLNLIHGMLEDPNMIINGEQPEIIIVLVGPSVNLVSTEKMKDNPAAKDKIAKKISDMTADGIRFEICMTAAHAFGVPADSVLPEIVQVKNGWISLVGYQQQGYSMIADF
ncbi:Intracellular sulfur oxidation protein, DsrE/DsrF family [Salinimicrobium catena]|uniref:Intracellular sulfur oxidation protein, DsrE/DsrF family n=1 Tax=Salinimicrobium catena TaxID=390640 RepID=A0A1H5N3J4_9FLAO|nr:DsrE family protein [Salinimicrobium catena]SDL35980.1 Intracellular sulfur oxidation protein, DsrE/DsrF family [Salinimicrobium catena]SEE96154.1 Intracellular sulfur oxidation protein, DsrE/DsrF family [Salinimicrobium catena]